MKVALAADELKRVRTFDRLIMEAKILSFVTMIIHGYNCFIILNVKEYSHL